MDDLRCPNKPYTAPRTIEIDEIKTACMLLYIHNKEPAVVSPISSPRQPTLCPPTQPLLHMNPSCCTIIHQKFTWRNFPILDAFLCGHANEYFAHAAHNYTASQKFFNNNLTSLLIHYAYSQGYAFDTSFSFEMIRNRVRCYFKSQRKRRTVHRQPTGTHPHPHPQPQPSTF
ncbi:hypothetical protein TrRE_jg11486 [Triparma retinervis]|uniref:Uncharacterized protein n=1 Tax=Triparma retinervis TaxID=2557542 RepID=A0A9W6Z6W9_9STRA|nr:hypothetical protein TrRE_jg11486 [Triparma retinervis]